jgi:hypothetical protein
MMSDDSRVIRIEFDPSSAGTYSVSLDRAALRAATPLQLRLEAEWMLAQLRSVQRLVSGHRPLHCSVDFAQPDRSHASGFAAVGPQGVAREAQQTGPMTGDGGTSR